MRLLIVEDEVRLADTLRQLLYRQGYTADVCHDGVSGLDNALTGIYDLVVLDVMLPGMNGFQVAQKLRSANVSAPVLMLTAKSSLDDRVPKELLACVRTLLRRSGGQVQESTALSWGDLSLERGTFTLSCGGREVRLSRREYDLMELLLRNGSQVVTKEQLLVKVWGYDSQAEDNNVEVYISFLRRKLTHLHSAVKIKTLRMLGYCLTRDEEGQS